MKRIAIAGASGFLGQELIQDILDYTDHEIVALVRSPSLAEHPRVRVKVVDLYRLKDVELALQGCDVGVYLVHSMGNSSRLTQASFQDLDYILADNFAKAAAFTGLKQLIYVGGIVPEQECSSKHLVSRLEVEKVLECSKVPLTTLRCSLIIGNSGSSFIILKKLIKRLPLMLLPKWAYTNCQPVALDDVLKTLMNVMQYPELSRGSFDVAGGTPMSYKELIKLFAKTLGKRRILIDVPLRSTYFSKLWVRIFAGASKKLVYPLVDSLLVPMVSAPERQLPEKIRPQWTPIDRAIADAIGEPNRNRRPIGNRRSSAVKKANMVRSVQRLPLPQGKSAIWVSRFYLRFLSNLFGFVVSAKRSKNRCDFMLWLYPKPLLSLELAYSKSHPDRPLMYVTGGVLAAPSQKARFEFRSSVDKEFVIAGVHEYVPRLPWYIYFISQAKVHALVMHLFALALRRVDNKIKLRKSERLKR